MKITSKQTNKTLNTNIMNNSNKILLSENANSYLEIIANKKQDFANGQMLIKMLDKLGLTVSKVDSWQSIEQHFMACFPKASIQFNIDANGITEQYREAEAFYLKHRHALRFEPLTDVEIEEIKESKRKYTTNANQVEAIELFNTVKDSLLRLKEIGIDINVNKTYLINRVLIGDDRQAPAIKVDPKALFETLINLK